MLSKRLISLFPPVKFQLIELFSLLPFLDFLVYKLEAQEALNKEKVGLLYSSEWRPVVSGMCETASVYGTG